MVIYILVIALTALCATCISNLKKEFDMKLNDIKAHEEEQLYKVFAKLEELEAVKAKKKTSKKKDISEEN